MQYSNVLGLSHPANYSSLASRKPILYWRDSFTGIPPLRNEGAKTLRIVETLNNVTNPTTRCGHPLKFGTRYGVVHCLISTRIFSRQYCAGGGEGIRPSVLGCVLSFVLSPERIGRPASAAVVGGLRGRP